MSTVYRFATFELQPEQRQLLADGRPVAVGSRAFDLLLALVERADHVVSKDDLLARVWPGLVVEENNLQVQVSTLRKILGAGAIATSAGRGYRFTPALLPAESTPAAAAARHNFPPQPTRFIGHEDDLVECAALLEQTRLLTLTGIGGCGKTRLAVELARHMLPSFADGVRYVDLAPLLDPERVPLNVATTFGLREENDRPVIDTLCRSLARQSGLLVLDNCEHLVAACAALVQQVLSAAPGMRVLAASREALGVPGERTVTVRSLSFPPAGSKLDLPTLESSEAVRLFVDRARLSVPRFSLADDNAAAVAEICRRLDGIPLAIELAAARVKVLSVDEIRARLDDRFRLLTGGSKAALARQQTLLATIRWSHEHLAADEQRLLRRLSVFVGGFSLEGATKVFGEAVDEYAVLDLIGRLVDQSLVVTQAVSGGTTRYAMLETVRQYGHDRLDDAGEGAATRDRHLDHYVALTAMAEPNLVGGPEQRAWLARLDLELENILAAHTWCDSADALAKPGLRLVASLHAYFRHRGLLALGYRVTVEALARAGAQQREHARCTALLRAAEIGFFAGRMREAAECFDASLAIAREIGDPERLVAGLRGTAHFQRDQGVARRQYEESIALARELPEKHHLAVSLNSLAEFHRENGKLEEAKSLYEEALTLARDLGHRTIAALVLANLAAVSIDLGTPDRARDLSREGLRISVEVGTKFAGGAHLDVVTGLAASLGQWELAARLFGAAETLSTQTGLRRQSVDEASLAPFIARTREALGAEGFAAAERAGVLLTYDEAIAEARAWLEERPVSAP